ncbi:hypothetical protein ACROYT_G033427 [Oculina patagonica]
MKSNHLFTESYSKVTAGFKNPSERNPDVPLRSRQHKFPVHTAPITDSFSYNDERIGSLDGEVLTASKNGIKPEKLDTNVSYDKTKEVPTMRKFAMRRSARMRKLKVLSSLHGTRMLSTASRFGDGKGRDAFVSLKTRPSSGTGEPYKTEINAPLKLTILPTEETVIPSVDTADAESDWILKEDGSAKEDEEKSSHNNDHKDDSLLHGEPKVTGHEGSTRHGGTSAIPQHKMAVHPGMKTSSGLRWNAAYEHAKLEESKKVKYFKKKKKSDSRTEDPADSHSPASTVAGILAGILMCLFIFTAVPRLWRIIKKRWRRRNGYGFGINIPLTGYLSEELSEEEVLFDRTAMERNTKSSKDTSPKSTPRRQKSVQESYQSSDHPTQEQKIWTLTDTPKSTPLMAVPTLDDTPGTVVWTVNEIPESRSLDSLFTTSSLSDLLTWTPTETPRSASLTSVSLISLSGSDICSSDSTTSSTPACDLTKKAVASPLLLTTESCELTIPESSLSPHPSTSKESSNLSLLPNASGELTRTLSMATDSTSSSTESCKTPVAARNEVVIDMDDDDNVDDEMNYTSEKSQHKDLRVVNFVDKETSREEVLIRIEHAYGENESKYEASSGVLIYTSEKLEMNNMTTDDAIIDIMPSDDEDQGPLALNDRNNDGKSLIGGRKALENRRFIKHLISEQESTEFKRDLNTAISRILGEKKHLEDKNKGKRNVIKHQTQETKYSLAESILRAKDAKMKKANGSKPGVSLPSLQQLASFFNISIPDVNSDVTICQCYYCDKHRKKEREKRLLSSAPFNSSKKKLLCCLERCWIEMVSLIVSSDVARAVV